MNKLITREDVTGEVKQEMLDSLVHGRIRRCGCHHQIGAGEKDPEVAAKAAEVLSGVGSASDIPALKKVLEKTDNEDVRTAVNDAIETLEP
jgi:hypothetical protein